MPLPDFTDPELGRIYLHPNSRARRITFRYMEQGELHVTLPPNLSRRELDEAIRSLRPKLLKNQEKSQIRTSIGEDFTLQSPYLRFRIERTESHYFQMQKKETETSCAEFTLLLPRDTDMHTPEAQQALRHITTETLRNRAKEVLLPLLARLAQNHGFGYTRASIHNSRSRWGSCSGRKTISLSLYLILLPEELIHYVLLHELCHTVEMNHSPAFWNLLDRYTGRQALALRHKLRDYHTNF